MVNGFRFFYLTLKLMCDCHADAEIRSLSELFATVNVANIEVSGETARVRKLVWAFAFHKLV